jgi:hypothetical protein
MPTPELSGVAHSEQNFAPGPFVTPQVGQALPRADR